jgi:predicted 3-demethylubiquinone-9 3-methyltransferase (glyoxalase superfamily)
MNVESAQKITPFLWFDGNAEEAVDFYCSVFPHAKKLGGLPGPGGKALTVAFELEGLRFTALNGGPNFKFNKAVSFVVACKDQAEIDLYWDKLTADGGREVECGWLDDKFGLSWQIVPENIGALLKHPKAMEAMMTMTKFVIADLEAAAAQS